MQVVYLSHIKDANDLKVLILVIWVLDDDDDIYYYRNTINRCR